jgi:hypothetical protein
MPFALMPCAPLPLRASKIYNNQNSPFCQSLPCDKLIFIIGTAIRMIVPYTIITRLGNRINRDSGAVEKTFLIFALQICLLPFELPYNSPQTAFIYNGKIWWNRWGEPHPTYLDSRSLRDKLRRNDNRAGRTHLSRADSTLLFTGRGLVSEYNSRVI